MKVVKEENQQVIVIGEGEGSIRLPIRTAHGKAMVLDIVEDVKKLTADEHVRILTDNQIEVPPGTDDYEVLMLAMSFVQNAWYLATNKDVVPQGILDGHAARLVRFEKAAEKARKNPPKTDAEGKPVAKTPKGPKAPKEPKAPKAEGQYAVNPAGDAVAASNLDGKSKWFYELLTKSEGPLTKNQILEKAKAAVADGAFKTEGAAQSQTNYQLGQLVKFNLIVLK